MIRNALRAYLFATFLVTSVVAQQTSTTPVVPIPPHTPQEVLLLFSGNTASERILLTLNNNRPGPLTTEITVYTVKGALTTLSPISMVPNESKQVELSPLLNAAGLEHQELGWLKLNYSGVVMEMGAQLTLYPGDGSVGVDSPRSLSGDFKSTSRDAVFWVPRSGVARLSLNNNSTSSILVKVHCDFLAEDLIIPAQTTTLRNLTMPDIGPFSGGGLPLSCEMMSDGPVNAFRPVGTVVAPDYSAPIRFYDPQTATYPSLTSVGLDTAASTHVIVHNNSDLAVVFSPVLREATLSAPYTQRLSKHLLAPHASREVNVAELFKLFNAKSIPRATLTLESSAPKGAFVGAVTQVNSTDGIIEDIPLRTSNPPAFARGSYPLRWDQDYTNLVTVTNTADKVLRIGASITAGDMVYVLKREDIEPGSTIVLDVDKMRRDHVPDVNGKYLPQDALYGKIHWIEMGMGKNAGLLGRTSLSSVLNKRRSSFSCGSTCYYSYDGYGFFDPLPWSTFTVGSSMSMLSSEHVSLVNGSSYTYPWNYGTLFTNPSDTVVSVANISNTNQVNESGVGMGNVEVNYDIYADQPIYDPNQEQCLDNYSDSWQSGISYVGKQVQLYLVDCSGTSTTGKIHGGWGTLSNLAACSLSADVPTYTLLPLGGSCVPNGANNAYRYTNANGSHSQVSLIGNRIVDASCSTFIDQYNGYVTQNVP